MAKRSRANSGFINGLPVPEWKSINPNGQFKRTSYKSAVESALYYIHYEVGYPERAKAFLSQANGYLDKSGANALSRLPISEFISPGKLAYLAHKGAILDDEYRGRLMSAMKRLEERALRLEQKEVVTEKPVDENVTKVSLKSRMISQIEELGGNLEECVDRWALGQMSVSDFDPYKMIRGYQPEVKGPHARILRGYFEASYDEAKLVVQFKNPEIREAYSHLSPQQRKEMLEIYDKIITACDVIIGARKAVRKPRIKKPADKTKLVSKIKFKTTEPSLGVASINPTEILGSDELWVFDTKSRKLGVYRSETPGSLTVKGTTIVGYDETKSTMKTVRKPDEVVKGMGKYTKSKINKTYSSIKATEARLRGRTNENTILLKAFK